MINKKIMNQTPVAIISLSINRDLLNRLDEQVQIEDRTRSKMIARMIEFYLDVNQFDFLSRCRPVRGTRL